jgi:hypothetical protein
MKTFREERIVNKLLTGTKTLFILKHHFNSTTRRVLFVGVLSLSLGTALFGVSAYSKRGDNLENTAESSEVYPGSYQPVNAPAVHLAQGENLQVKLVTLTSRGFDPDEVLTTNGRFILDIENISGFPNASISLANNSTNAVVQTTQMPRGKIDYVKAFDLAAGTYVLTEASHPEWTCTITVQPKQ